MANEEERFDDDSKRDTLLCQHLTKRLLCRVKKKPIKKHYMDISNYTSSKLHQPRPTSSPLTSLAGENTTNDDAIDLLGGESQMAVIYKQQS